MTTVFDVPPAALIDRVADQLKQAPQVAAPEWAPFVRTGVHTEKSPTQRDWWHRRVAAVFRKVYVLGPVGTERLAAEFGGRRDKGSAPYHPRKGSRAIIRLAVQQLEEIGYVAKAEKKGRAVTGTGRKFLDTAAREVLMGLAAKNPELMKYGRAK